MNLPIVCIAKAVRTIGFGAVSVVLALFLMEKGFSPAEVGILFSLTLLEDALVTTLASVLAGKIGMRNVLLLSSLAILLGGFAIAFAPLKWMLSLAVIFGVISPAGYEGGPFGSIEQAIISQSTKHEKLTSAFSWYNLVGFGGAALGALLAGGCVALMKAQPVVLAYQSIIVFYAVSAFVLALLYLTIDIAEIPRIKRAGSVGPNSAPPSVMVLPLKKLHITSSSKSGRNIRNLAFLQGIDAFGGGFVVQSLLTCWFYQRYHVDATFLGPVFFGCNVIAALSFFFAPAVVKRIGLLNAMVFTHLPCSLALCAMPFLPTASWAAGLLLLRSAFSSMDIPARQAYTMLIVAETDRPAAAGVITSARAVAQGIAPCLTGFLMNNAVTGLPLILAGALKSVYDVSLYHAFKHVPFHHEPEADAPRVESPPDDFAELESRKPERVR
jgi:MFS family permease